ncbi:hypothetical protein MTR67_018453 [Solanum verrucosum]|uniref:Uncharacterized protein n=1 Tax=Solanum verrucosum TaxID=315347 RepID=A0AAF0QMJ1_SOLVR|nr:hypothetical protein MTR67_018453 [Solanum verrucosum]
MQIPLGLAIAKSSIRRNHFILAKRRALQRWILLLILR